MDTHAVLQMDEIQWETTYFLVDICYLQTEAADECRRYHPSSVKKMSKSVDNNSFYDVRSWGNMHVTYQQTLSYGGPGERYGL